MSNNNSFEAKFNTFGSTGGGSGGSPSPANPSAEVGATAVNGTALTYMRSDSAPALEDSGVSAGTYGDGSNIPQVTIDAKGRVTSATDVPFSDSGVSAGTYGDANNIPQVTIDAKGRVTNASNIAVSILSPTLPTNNIFLGNASNVATANSPSISLVGTIIGESSQVIGDFLQFQNDGSGNSVLGTQSTAFNFEKTVCVIIPTSTSYPDSAVNWFYQNASFNKWTPTALNSIIRKKDFLGLKDINIQIFVSAMSDNSNPVSWQLKLIDTSNPANSINLLTSSDAGSSNIITIGGSYGNFGVGWTEFSKDFTTAGGNDLDTLFFTNFSTTQGQLELHIANNGSNGSIITGCTSRFLSI